MALFNKYGDGAVEIQKLTGIFAAANDYPSIATEIASATREVAGLVGQGVIQAAEAIYETAKGDVALLRAVQLPVAVLAIARYSALTLVSHEDSGRKLKADENDKMPWEWMIDRDDRAQMERWYRAMDALYDYLETNRVPAWMESSQRKALGRSIVPSLSVFEAVYPLDHSYYVYAMLQHLVVEYQPKIRKRIGAELWAAITAKTVAEERLTLLDLCRRMAILCAVVTAVRRWSLEVFPLTVARRFAPSYQGGKSSRAATTEEMEAYIGRLQEQIGEVSDEIAGEISGANPYEDFDLMPGNDPRNKFFTAQ